MARLLFLLFIIYVILTLLGCLDEFSTVSGEQNTLTTPTNRQRDRRVAIARPVEAPPPHAGSAITTPRRS